MTTDRTKLETRSLGHTLDKMTLIPNPNNTHMITMGLNFFRFGFQFGTHFFLLLGCDHFRTVG